MTKGTRSLLRDAAFLELVIHAASSKPSDFNAALRYTRSNLKEVAAVISVLKHGWKYDPEAAVIAASSKLLSADEILGGKALLR